MNRSAIAIGMTLVAGVALGIGVATVLGAPGGGSPGNGADTDTPLVAQLRVAESERAALQQAILDSQDQMAAVRTELEAARAALAAMQAEQAAAAETAESLDDLLWEEDGLMAEVQNRPEFADQAALQEARAAQAAEAAEDEQRRWDPERIAAMRAERDERVRSFFDDAFERAPSRESQERIAAIEAYTQDAMELMRNWRGASEEEREVLREQMGSMRDAMRDLMREEHDARVREVAARMGVEDARQQQALANAIREVQSDPLFRGGGWTGGRGGGPAPMWGGGGGRGGWTGGGGGGQGR